MPHPLSKVRPQGASFSIGNSGYYPLLSQPTLACLAMEGIATWANVESFLLGFYVDLAGGSGADAAAVYLALETASAKTSAVQVLAKRRLDEAHQELLTAILSVAKSAQKDRDKLAHWVWGTSADVPEALLLADPRALAVLDRESDDFAKNVYVYKQADFRSIIAANERLCGYALQFRFILWKHPTNREGKLFAELSAEPEIAERLRRQAKRA